VGVPLNAHDSGHVAAIEMVVAETKGAAGEAGGGRCGASRRCWRALKKQKPVIRVPAKSEHKIDLGVFAIEFEPEATGAEWLEHQRALAVYYGAGDPKAVKPQELGPPGGIQTKMDAEGKRYILLRTSATAEGVVAVYRVRQDGILKRLKRWPAAIV
jgi:hypothetical protein